MTLIRLCFTIAIGIDHSPNAISVKDKQIPIP